jgi:hypothetical protein
MRDFHSRGRPSAETVPLAVPMVHPHSACRHRVAVLRRAAIMHMVRVHVQVLLRANDEPSG